MHERGPLLCTLSLQDLRHYSSGRSLYLFFVVGRLSRFLLQHSEPEYDANLLKRMTTTLVSPVRTIPSEYVFRARIRSIRTLVSASSWLHCSIGGLFPT